MILAQHFNPEEDFYAIPPVDIYANGMSDAVNWQAVLPGKQIVKVASNMDFVKWQQSGFKIKIEQEVCKFFGLLAETEDTSIAVTISRLTEKVELPHTFEVELQEEEGKVAFVVDGFKNTAIELADKETILCKSKNFELELKIVELANLPKKFLVKLKPYLAHELQGMSLV